MRTRIPTIAALTLIAGSAWAHEGHGASGWFHYLLEPVHAAPVVLAVAAIALNDDANGMPRGGLKRALVPYLSKTWPLWGLMFGVTATVHWDCLVMLLP